jgi:hypothetical protein
MLAQSGGRAFGFPLVSFVLPRTPGIISGQKESPVPRGDYRPAGALILHAIRVSKQHREVQFPQVPPRIKNMSWQVFAEFAGIQRV